jgi:glycosyltransferase involved in cell wall biosynthesis
MPVYNPGAFLPEAIESILRQTYRDFELIVVDDASTDGSLEIISSYADSRIVLLCNEENRGVALTRNRGLSVARGEYTALMDAEGMSRP